MNYLILQILVYFIIIQAFFLGLHFSTIKKPIRVSDRILGFLLFSFAIAILSFRIILDTPAMNIFFKKYLYIIHLMLSLSMYIFLLFYVQSIYKKKLNYDIKHNLIHIIFFISYFVYSQILITKIPTLQSHDLKLYIIINSYKVSLYFLYLFWVFAYLKKEHVSFAAFFSIEKNPNLLWLVVLLSSFIFLWFVEFFILIVAILDIVAVLFKFIVISSIVVPFIFINAILIMALKKPLIFYVNQSITSRVMKEDQHNYIKRFIELMEKEKIFQDPELTLNKTAGLLKINPKYLSHTLNRQLHSSFPDIVNKYRIETCKKLLENGGDLTIQQIMYDAGYSSKSAFLKHFKRITGSTPSEYKTQLSKRISSKN